MQDTLTELGSLASEVVLLLLVNLRHCLMAKQKEAKFGPKKDRLGSSNTGMSDATDTFHTPSLQANTATLKVILSNIVEWILKSGNFPFPCSIYGYLFILFFLEYLCITEFSFPRKYPNFVILVGLNGRMIPRAGGSIATGRSSQAIAQVRRDALLFPVGVSV